MTEEEEARLYIKSFECLKGKYKNDCGIFVLGCADKARNTVLSQQHRAISLINAMDCLGRFDAAKVSGQRPKIAIVGGGVAGITAAVCAAKKDIEVDLFEEASEVLTLFQGASHRKLHPNLFNWPKDGSLNLSSQLPFLNWQFNGAFEVAKELRNQFYEFRTANLDILHVHPNSRRKLPPDSSDRPTIVSPNGGDPQGFDHVIAAVGFGKETESHGASYWISDDFTSRRSPYREYIVVGNGDGGLIDTLRLRIGEMGPPFEDQIISFLNTWKQKAPAEYENVAKRILEIEGAHPDPHESTELRNKYTALWRCALTAVELIGERLRDDTKVFLVGRPIHPEYETPLTLYSGWQAPINRFLISLLQKVDERRFVYEQGVFERRARDAEGWDIKYEGRKDPLFSSDTHKDSNRLILRIGPGSSGGGASSKSPLEFFSEEAARDARRLGTYSELDLHSRFFEYPKTRAESGGSKRESDQLQELPTRPSDVTGLKGIERPKVVRKNPYLLGAKLVGRASEMANLRSWFADPSPAKRLRCVCDFGGAGKTALAWGWLTDNETQKQRDDLGYREFWTSFYARDYGWQGFIQDLAEALGTKVPEMHDTEAVWQTRTDDIIDHLKNEKWLLLLDGLEREMEGYAAEANFGADSEEQDSRKEAELVCDSESSIRYPILAEFMRRLNETRAKVLVTSRLFPKNLEGIAEEYPLEKAALTRELAAELWKQQTQISGTDALFDRFFQLVEYHPQTIAVVAAAVEAASDTIQSFDDWFNDALSETKEACLDVTASRTSRRHRWLGLATADLPLKRPKEWILLCRVTSRSKASNRSALVSALVKSGTTPLFENEQKLLNGLESLQKRRLLGFDPDSGEIDVHPVIRTVVYHHVSTIKDSNDNAMKALWQEMKAHLDDQELLLKELSALGLDDRAKRMEDARGIDSKARLDLFRDFYVQAGANPWLSGLPALTLRRDQASVDFRTALALGEIGETEAAQRVIARAKTIFDLNNDDQALRECITSENWLWLYGGSLFDFERRYLSILESGEGNDTSIYWLAISLAIRKHPSAAAVLNKIGKGDSRWKIQTIAEANYYLEDYQQAQTLANEARNNKQESVPIGQELWEWVTLGLALLRQNKLDLAETFLKGAHSFSKSVHYRIVRLFALAGKMEHALIRAQHYRREIDSRGHISNAMRFSREYDELDEYRRYPIPASEAMLAKAKVLHTLTQSENSLAAARESLRHAYGKDLGFSYASGVRRAEDFLSEHFPGKELPERPKDTRALRDHEAQLERFINKYLGQ